MRQCKKATLIHFIGTYTNSGSQGIYKYIPKKDGSLERIGLAAKSDNPSFLTRSANKKYLIAVNEIDHEGAGAVESFLITDDSLVFFAVNLINILCLVATVRVFENHSILKLRKT